MSATVERHLKIPSRFRKESYLKAFEYALYRLLFIEHDSLDIEHTRNRKESGITTRVQLSEDADSHFSKLQALLDANITETAMTAFLHIDDNKSLYSIKEENTHETTETPMA